MLLRQCDRDGYYLGSIKADPSPMEPGVWLIPGGAIDAPLPTPGPNQRSRWDAGQWIYEDIPSDIHPLTPPPPTREEQLRAIEVAIEARLDAHARTRGYRDAATCISYLTSGVTSWASEASDMQALRDATWTAWHDYLATVVDDPLPSDESLWSMLPAIVWSV